MLEEQGRFPDYLYTSILDLLSAQETAAFTFTFTLTLIFTLISVCLDPFVIIKRKKGQANSGNCLLVLSGQSATVLHLMDGSDWLSRSVHWLPGGGAER